MICVCVNSVSVYPSCVALKTGEWYHDVYAVACPADADCRDVRWYSSNTSVATVNATTGFIYARSAGTTRVYAEATDGSGCKDYITVTVTSGTIKVSSVGLNRSYVSIEEGESVTLHATVCPVNASNKTLCWSSSNTNVAVVDSSGTVTAKSRGRATITATAQDGSGVHDCCDINVTGDILVSSVSVSPSCKTVTVGSSFYLHETVCPTNATNKCVTWSSSNTSVATVNSSGLVLAKGAGNATITAAAADGSGKKGNCIVTVNAPIRVESVEVCPATKTMNVGETACLSAIVCPYNAANRSVIWCSSDEDVATVGTYTGMVRAKNAGTVTITATTVDGRHSSSMRLTVMLETVTIQKDGPLNKVVFSRSGKVWRCINRDMIYDENFSSDFALINRSNYNYYTYFNEDDPVTSDTTPKEYSDEEIQLLYAIDPYGVAKYVQRYAEHYTKDQDIMGYKDRIFKLLFKREPKYFARALDGTWYETEGDYGNRSIVSESESYFGMHQVYDWTTLLEMLGFGVDILCLALGTPIFKATTAVNCVQRIFTALSVALSAGESFLKGELIDFAAGSIVEKAFDGTNLAWAHTAVSFYTDLQEIVDGIVAEPNYNVEILKYCVNKTNYDVRIVLENGEVHKVKDICDIIDKL